MFSTLKISDVSLLTVPAFFLSVKTNDGYTCAVYHIEYIIWIIRGILGGWWSNFYNPNNLLTLIKSTG